MSQGGQPQYEAVPSGTSAGSAMSSLVEQAAKVVGAPVALAGFLEDDREVIVAAYGWELSELPMLASFTAALQGEGGVVVAPDAENHPDLREHLLVCSEPYVRLYIGIPIADPEGRHGRLSILDRAPRSVHPQQLHTLRLIGEQFTREMASMRERDALRSQLELARESLQEAETRFREFFEQTDDFVVSLTPEGRVLHANEPFLQTLGIGSGDLARTTFERLVAPTHRQAFQTALAQAFESAQPTRVETEFRRPGGGRIIVDGILRPRVGEGLPPLVRVIFRDITDRKDFEIALANARDAALEAARLKTQFLTNVSHEIRTPMNGILGMLDLLVATGLSTEQADYVQQARASAEQLHSIVDNVLSVSSLEAGRVGVSQLDFDLYRTLARIVDVMRVAALGKDLTLDFSFGDGVPTIIRGSRIRLSQVVTNLMENAIKFTERGSVSLRVSLQKETETHRVIRFEVRDTGIGVSDEDRLLLFERFSQVDGASTRRYGGVGLGLAAARHLVETMGGLIDVESTPAAGSTFWFSIPFPKQGASRTPLVSSDLDLKNRRILLYDPLATSRKIIRHYLEVSWLMRVEVADGEESALQILRQAAAAGDPMEAVVADAFPGRAVEHFAAALRTDASLGGPRLVALLASGAASNDEKLRESGVSSSISRPVAQNELFEALAVAFAHVAAQMPRSPRSTQPVPRAAAAAAVAAEERSAVRIVVAEDNFLNRKLTLTQLEKLGYTATAVGNGRELLEAHAAQTFDLVLMDCQMPIVDGYEATLELRKREKRGSPRVWIIAMTANAREGDREKCLAAGMDAYLSKPTKHEELEQAIAEYFESRNRPVRQG